MSNLIEYRDYDVNFCFKVLTPKYLNEKCKLYVGKLEEKNIYKLLNTTLTNYETMKLSYLKVDTKSTTIPFQRRIVERDYFIEDNTYPFYKGLYCHRDSYMGSSSSQSITKFISLHEINLVDVYFHLVYLYTGNIFNEEEVKKHYTEFEYNILLGELMTSLILNIISESELETLIGLMKRDPVIADDIEQMEKLISFSAGVTMNPVSIHSHEVRLDNPTVGTILRIQMIMYLNPILHQTLAVVSAKTNFKSMSDFRMIFEMEDKYESFILKLNVPKGTKTEHITVKSISLTEKIDIIERGIQNANK